MRMRLYMKSFDATGVRLEDWTEITDDVIQNSMGDIRQQIADDDFEVGVFKFADFALELRNDHGLYAEVGNSQSLFLYKRSDTLIKITWQKWEREPIAGVVVSGDFISGNAEVTVFEGLLNDDATDSDIQSQSVNFKVLGLESIFKRVGIVPLSITNGDLVSEILYTILNQTLITDLFDVDALNLNPDLDVAVDDVSKWEDVKGAMDDLLALSNSVFYISEGAAIVKSHDAIPGSVATFYGQASPNGIENTVNITEIKSGTNRAYNTWTWDDTVLSAVNASSVLKNGLKTQAISYEAITNNTTRQTILDTLRDDFGDPRMELKVTTNITEAMLGIDFLETVSIDYPTIFYAADGHPFPIYGVSRYGEGVYGIGVWSLTIPASDQWKVMGRTIKMRDRTIEFKLRKVS